MDIDKPKHVRLVTDVAEVQNLVACGFRIAQVITRSEKILLSKQFPYPSSSPGCAPMTYFYNDEVLGETPVFLVEQDENNIVAGLQKEMEALDRAKMDAESREHALKGEVGSAVKMLEKKDSEIADLKVASQKMIDAHNTVKEALEKSRQEYNRLKEAMARAIVKLPGGNEASVLEAVEMVRTGDIIMEEGDGRRTTQG